jgi:hypothetical protein
VTALSTLSINFEGWCQIRLPTNPDPPDEPRGVSGYTFALAGEPDLDRVIRFHDPVAPRTHAEVPDVRVRSVTLGGKEWKGSPLLDGPVNLLNEDGETPRRPIDPKGPKFEERNYILTLPGDQPIDPFYIQVKSKDGGIELARRQVLERGNPEKPIWNIERDTLKKFGSISFIIDSGDVAEATGVLGEKGRVAYRRKRLRLIEDDLRKAKQDGGSPEAIAALEKRCRELKLDEKDPKDRRTVALGACETRNFPLSGKNPTVQGERLLGGTVDREQDWLTEFWFGGWDCDGLVCYVKGMLAVPFRLNSGAPPSGAAALP